jgi:succinate dehydrogenase/fumarate reductase flavoprotein subunit
VRDRVTRLPVGAGTRPVDWFHRELGKIMWDYCGMARNAAGLEKALSEIPALREEFHQGRAGSSAGDESSTRASRRPAGSPTSSSSPS